MSAWTRTPGPSGGACGAEWRHTSGAVVRHCGHPTALYPYYGFDARGERVMVKDGSETLGCWKSLKEIQEAALAQAEKPKDATRPPYHPHELGD